MEPEGSLLCSQGPTNGPYPVPEIDSELNGSKHFPYLICF